MFRDVVHADKVKVVCSASRSCFVEYVLAS